MVNSGNIRVDSGLSSLFCLVRVDAVMASSLSRHTYSGCRQLELFCYFLCAVSEIFCYHQWPATVLCSIAVSRTCTYDNNFDSLPSVVVSLGRVVIIKCAHNINFELSCLCYTLYACRYCCWKSSQYSGESERRYFSLVVSLLIFFNTGLIIVDRILGVKI